ncbi:hypothetical protein QN277_029203 [Acacia crassicarpa]|uniref:Protein kinase domain-containing protein n=1 Tax=Acacia crassicarpa TaxID=499986 RepID=A0AAE1J6I9_9FABA|nr:hypothetical protein QN277_029203 [Acacia crassicarpa]
MSSVYASRFLLFFHFVLVLLSVGYGNVEHHDKCPTSFDCDQFGSLHFPFTKPELQHCGFITVNGCDDPSSNKTIQLEENGRTLPLKKLVQQENLITVLDQVLRPTCEVFDRNMYFPLYSPLASFHVKHNVTTLFRCNHDVTPSPPAGFINLFCPEFNIFCPGLDLPPPSPPILDQPQTSLTGCSSLQLPCKNLTYTPNFSLFSCGEIDIEVQLFDGCNECYHLKGGQCLVDNHNNFYCDIETGSEPFNLKYKLGLAGLFIGAIGFAIITLCLLEQHYKQHSSRVQLQATNNNAIDPNSDTDLQRGRYLGTRLFSYEELGKATNNFERSRELRNGGLSSVYYGKLQDGQEVAIKRLNNKNYRRLEQFLNEVEILARVRHQNLVSLYGCTSHHSRELLLVYEYVPNSTVSSHLHGELANLCLLPWHVRMKVAIETATALAYLHASNIIHCDIKTDNILLDNNLCVKVAGFGLSRLSLIHVTHVSTTPQGTPGYIDPESNQGRERTCKSDVYSFGVVLIELISSKPAVDMNRPKEEKILANLAIKKIQKSAIKELVDPSLGFESSYEVRRKIACAAELAFQCLQGDKELRPSMYEVLEILTRIESGKEELNCPEEVNNHGVTGTLHSGTKHSPPPPSPDNDEAILLKNI